MLYGDFAGHVGSQFTLIDDGGASIGLVLEEARAAPAAATAAATGTTTGATTADRFPTPFSLIFHATAGDVLPQRTYALRHPVLGELAIFLVPIAKTMRGVSYEAAFG